MKQNQHRNDSLTRAPAIRFICTGCGTDWMTVLSEAEAAGLCQRCYHMRQVEYVEWVR